MNNGELNAYNYFQQNGWRVDDLTDNPNYYDKDIDFRISNDTETHTIEVKWDSRIATTGNMFIETITDLDNKKEGWFSFCQAEFIYYGDSKNNLFYVFRTEDLRSFVSTRFMQERKAADYNYQGILKKVSQGMLVPIKEFSQCFNVQIILLDSKSQGFAAKKLGQSTKIT